MSHVKGFRLTHRRSFCIAVSMYPKYLSGTWERNLKWGKGHGSNDECPRNKNTTNVTELIIRTYIYDVTIFDDRSIAESMNEYFISIATKLADEIDSNSDNQNDDLTYANEFLETDSFSTNLFHFRTISVTSVALRLSKLLASKSTGMDNIPAKVLKITANIIAPSLTYISNISLQSGIYVHDWKLAKIIPIYKSEDRKKLRKFPTYLNITGNK